MAILVVTIAGVAHWRGRFERLRIMSSREVAWRIKQAVGVLVAAVRSRIDNQAHTPSRFWFARAEGAVLPRYRFDVDPTFFERRILGEWDALGHWWQFNDDDELVWRRAPDTALVWPDGICLRFSVAFPSCGDPRVVWEPGRLQQLVWLAMVASTVQERRQQCVRMIRAQVLSWDRLNDPFWGIHSASAMEAGLRIIALCHAVDLIREEFKADGELWSAVLRIVLGNARRIACQTSEFSSAGNHSIAEAAGLVYAAALFPEAGEAQEWRRVGMSQLVREAGRQILPDGGGIEQSLDYHCFIVDLLILVADLFVQLGLEVPDAIDSAVARALDFINTVTIRTPSDARPGDSDSGEALCSAVKITESRVVYQGDNKTRIFPHTGLTIINQRDANGSLSVLFDHGPLGMGPGCGHGHADALSVVAWSNESTLLFDCGTFSYTGYDDLRRYFRGTRAHNTLEVEEVDQAVQAGAFLWKRPYSARLFAQSESEHGSAFLAYHDGYEQRFGGVHWRAILVTDARVLLVLDRLLSARALRGALRWHTPSRTDASTNGCVFTAGAEAWQLAVFGRGQRNIFEKGGPHWRSPRYGQLEHGSGLEMRFDGREPIQAMSVLRPMHTELPIEAIRWLKEWSQWYIDEVWSEHPSTN